jgi:hypothetical protein
MAGKGKKTFVAGEVLIAQDVNEYLMDQTVMNFASSAARSSAIPTPTQGMVSYQKDTDAIEAYDGSKWVTRVSTSVPLAIATGSGSVTGNASFTYPVDRFTLTPVLGLTMLSASGTAGNSVTYGNPTTSGFTAYVWAGTAASTSARTVVYHAIQMTSSSSSG